MSGTQARDTRRLTRTATPGIYKRGDRSYVVVFRDHTRKQRRKYARTLAEARALKATCVADVERGEYRAVSKVRFAEYAPQWIAGYTGRTKRGIGARTLAMYRDDLGLDTDDNPTGAGAVAFFGRTPLAQIGPGDIKRYAARLSANGLACSSVKRKLAPVKALLADAHEEGLIRFNPTAGVRIVTPAREDEEAVERVKALGPTELAAVIDNAPDEWRLFVMFLAETGLRIGEAVECRWSDLDRGSRRLTVARQWHRGTVGLPKGRKTRTVPVSARLDALLWEHRKTTRAHDDALMFVGPLGARLDAGNLAERMLKPACVAAGVGEMVASGKGKLRAVSWVSWHTFRHTCASQLFRGGWNAKQVSRFLGHADAGFTLRTYVHVLDEDLPEPNILSSLAGRPSGADETRVAIELDAPIGVRTLAPSSDVSPPAKLLDFHPRHPEKLLDTRVLSRPSEARKRGEVDAAR
jgi:integrase